MREDYSTGFPSALGFVKSHDRTPLKDMMCSLCPLYSIKSLFELNLDDLQACTEIKNYTGSTL